MEQPVELPNVLLNKDMFNDCYVINICRYYFSKRTRI